MLPPLLLLIALGAAILLEPLSISFLPSPMAGWSLTLGLALVAAGIALAAWSTRAFRSAGTNLSPHLPSVQLVTSGPYRLTRNPIYLGFVLFLAGISLMAALEWGLILTPVLALVLHFGVVLPEERYLAAKFGQAYSEYRRQTRRWL